MNSLLAELVGVFTHGWVWGVIGIVIGAMVENAVNGKPARARAPKPRERR